MRLLSFGSSSMVHTCTHNWVIASAIVVAIALNCTHDSFGQDQAFSTITLGADVAKDVSDADFQQLWTSRLAANVFAETPFYFGHVRMGVRYLQARSQSVTDVRTIHLRASWGPDFKLSERVKLIGGLSVGTLFMSFADEPVAYRRSESELAFGASAGVVVRLSSRVSFEAAAELSHAFTATPLDFIFVSSGFRYELRTPDWLKTFLD